MTALPDNRRISEDTLQNFIMNPFGKAKGFGKWTNRNSIEGVKIGNLLFVGTNVVLKIDGEDEMYFTISDTVPYVICISAVFYDASGKVVLSIEENAIYANTDAWDFICMGNTLQLNNSKYNIEFRMIIHNKGIIEIDRINYYRKGYSIVIDRKGNTVIKSDLGNLIEPSEMRVMFAECAVEVVGEFFIFGKGERTTLKRGVSQIINLRPKAFAREPRRETKQDVILPRILPRITDFEGKVNGVNVSIRDNYFGPGITPIVFGKDSIQVGVPDNMIEYD